MQRLLISPTPGNDSGNYIENLARSLSGYFSIVNYGKKQKSASKEVFQYFIKTDIFLLNWTKNEPIRSNGFIRFILVEIFLILAKVFKKKVIWTFHNLEPHKDGSNIRAKNLALSLTKAADVIIHHTSESLHLTPDRNNFCFFIPFEKPLSLDLSKRNEQFEYDILIWGGIAPYKGVAEFLEFLKNDSFLSTLKVLVAGEIRNEDCREELVNSLSKNVTFGNRFYSDEELVDLHKVARYVFFSYQGNSVLNSGQLVFSLGLGADIIGPSKGAFKELQQKGLIYTYDNFEEVCEIIKPGKSIDKSKQKRFIVEHSWDRFSEKLNKHISCL